jgi:2-polyprenyl-3-methyl-5-hydroxy-6-metoxy-1,4-benzoquinol methylase
MRWLDDFARRARGCRRPDGESRDWTAFCFSLIAGNPGSRRAIGATRGAAREGSMQTYVDYAYRTGTVSTSAGELIGPIEELCGELGPAIRVLEAGCGRGFYAGWFAGQGCIVVGVDQSPDGLDVARRAYPTCRFEQKSIERGLLSQIGELPFDLVICTRRIDQLADPRGFVGGAVDALRPGGRLICAAPHLGYLKHVAAAVARESNRAVSGSAALWTRRALASLLHEAGFTNVQFRTTGRLPLLASSLVVAGDRPFDSLSDPLDPPPLVA